VRRSEIILALTTWLCLGISCLDGAALVYSKRFGGTNADVARAVTADREGNVYVAGSTQSLNFPAVGAIQPLNGGAALLTVDEGKSWNSPAIDAAVYSVTAARTQLYAGTSNGVYRSGDSGRTWARVSPALSYAVYGVWADPRTPARLVAASAQGVLISDDAGATWRESNQGIEPRTDIPSSLLTATAVASPTGRMDTLFVAVVGAGALYRSLDAGATWSKLNLAPGPVPVWTVVTDPTRAGVVYAGVASSGVFRTLDGGNTWRNVANISLNYGPHTIAAAPGRIYAARTDGVSISTDGGETWRNAGLAGQSVRAVAVDPGNGALAWALASGVIYRTTDGGATWRRVGPLVSTRFQNIAVFGQAIFVSGEPGEDVFLTKWDPAGSRIVFSTYLGGSGTDHATGVALDAAGNIWVVGDTSSPDFPVTNQSRLTGEQNAFVAKISADGSRVLYASYLGGGTWDSVSALAVDASGAVYLVGYTESADFPATAGALQATYRSGCTDPPAPGYSGRPNRGDAFLAKLRSDGAVEYATYLGGSCGDTASGIAVDSSGSAYVVGYTNSADFPVTAGSMQVKYGGGAYDGFVAKLNAGGTGLVYSTFLGDDKADSVAAVAVDAAGAAYIAGSSTLFPVDRFSSCHGAGLGDGHGLGLAIDGGPFVAKLSRDGSGRVFGQPLGGRCSARSASIALDASGNIWISGNEGGSSLPMVAPVQAFGLGSGYLTQLDPGGANILFSTLIEGGAQMALDRTGNVYVAGYTFLGDNPKELLGGGLNRGPSAVVAKVDPSRVFPLRLDTPAKAGQRRPPLFLQPEGAAPGQVLRLIGRGLGPAVPVSAAPDGSGAFPKSLAGVEVRFDDRLATLLSAGDTEILCIVPFAVAGQQASTIQVLYHEAASNPVAVAVTPVSLETFAVVNPDWSLNSYDNPASAGSFVTIFVSGLGLTDPPGVDGQPNLGPGRMLNPLTATLNNAPAQILYAGPAPGLVAGVGQVNVALPASAGSDSLSLELVSGQSHESLSVNIR